MEIQLTLDEFIDRVNKLNNHSFDKALTTACLEIENKAKINCPVGTGELRNSITHEVKDNEGVVGTNIEYAPYVEYGTGIFAAAGDGRDTPWTYQDAEGNWHTTIGQAPQPYLIPAFDEVRDKVPGLIYDEFIEVLKNGGL